MVAALQEDIELFVGGTVNAIEPDLLICDQGADGGICVSDNGLDPFSFACIKSDGRIGRNADAGDIRASSLPRNLLTTSRR